MSDRNLLQVTPFLPMKDLGRAVRFFVEILGFNAVVDTEYYAYLDRDSAAVRLSKLSPDCAEERFEYGPRTWLFYVDVEDVSALVAEIRPKLLGAGHAPGEGPVDQTWGKREWWAPGPEGGFIVFGQEIVRNGRSE